ncbi:MAG: DsbA family oxidoreductase [Sporichthyaceae bacterium]
MKVEVWSDVTCPWCGIGFHRLRSALAAFEHGAKVEVVHRSFELAPNAPDGVWPVRENMAAKYAMSPEQVEASLDRIEAVAAAEGIAPYRLRDNVVGSTALAHEFLAIARSRGVGEEAWAAVFDRYFGQAASVFDVDSLVDLAEDVGLDPDRTRRFLTERRFRFTVETDDQALRSRGVNAVPYHLFAGRFALPGTDTVEVLLNALNLAWEREGALEDAVLGRGEVCGPDGCA